jgi:hypothetical protein
MPTGLLGPARMVNHNRLASGKPYQKAQITL